LVGRARHIDGKFAGHPAQRHAVAAGAALDGLQRRVVERHRFAVLVVAGDDPAG